MKKIVNIVLLCICFQAVLSQDVVDICDSVLGTPPISYLKSSYIPDENTPIKYIKVNFHFMLKATGEPDNFTETDDGTGNPNFTGYDYARNAIQVMNNNYLGNNRQMRLPPGNNTEVLPMKILLVLQGVYFHRNDVHHYWENVQSNPSILNSYYGIDDACNVYLVGSHDSPVVSLNGKANIGGGLRLVLIKNIWYFYENDPDPFYGIRGIIHELGHNFGLIHTILTGGGKCCDGDPTPYCDDQCSDTPTWEYIVNTLGEPDPCCWDGLDCSNNIMDYSANRQALTPCQLGIAHECIEVYLYDYMLRSHTNNITICDIGYPNITHIGKNITISGTSCSTQPVKIEDTEEIDILFNESVTIEPQFEIELGGELSIDTYVIF